MAFQAPTRQAINRPSFDEAEDRNDSRAQTAIVGVRPPEDSQTWVVFSPTADADTATGASSELSSVSQSQSTPGRSRLSDLGSLRSYERSSYAASSAVRRPRPLQPASLVSDGEDDAELDSLDSHLADFRALPNTHAHASPALARFPSREAHNEEAYPSMNTTATTTVNLPTHDGLGTFQFGRPAGMGSAMQERLYAFEQFNPRRVTKRRRESLDLAQLQLDQEISEEMERIERIEKWRRDNSMVLLREIRRETRRRRGSELSSRRSRVEEPAAAAAATAVATAAMAAAIQAPVSASAGGVASAVSGDAAGNWHDQEDDEHLVLGTAEDGEQTGEGLWSRLTRKLVVEIMGIDDKVLSIIFGEDLPEYESPEDEEEKAEDKAHVSSMPRASDSLLKAYDNLGMNEDSMQMEEDLTPSWQLRMLRRIAKELGQLVHRHMTSHPGAFSTYMRMQQMPLPYAGLPAIPEARTPPDMELAYGGASRRDGMNAAAPVAAVGGATAATAISPTVATTASLPAFQPTILSAQPRHIPRQQPAASVPAAGLSTAAAATAMPQQASGQVGFTQDEWEQDLDIKLVFRYLRSRFISDTLPSSSHTHHHHAHHSSTSSNVTTSMNLQDAAAKAARVRQHHPLVGRTANRQTGGDRRPMSASRNMGTAGAAPSSPAVAMRHQHGSCASQSTRRSARRSSVSSSRHYWDIGGSIGTGSMVQSVGPMGSWGEV